MSTVAFRQRAGARRHAVDVPRLRELLPLLAKLNQQQLNERFPTWRSPADRDDG